MDARETAKFTASHSITCEPALPAHVDMTFAAGSRLIYQRASSAAFNQGRSPVETASCRQFTVDHRARFLTRWVWPQELCLRRAHLAVASMEALVPADTQQHLYDLVKHYDTALVITYRADGKAHARPMAVAQLQADLDAYFATSITSPKVEEIEVNSSILVAFQSESEHAVIYGKATIVRDRNLIHKLWSESWRLWFPDGKDDPSICLVRVDAEEANTGIGVALKG